MAQSTVPAAPSQTAAQPVAPSPTDVAAMIQAAVSSALASQNAPSQPAPSNSKGSRKASFDTLPGMDESSEKDAEGKPVKLRQSVREYIAGQLQKVAPYLKVTVEVCDENAKPLGKATSVLAAPFAHKNGNLSYRIPRLTALVIDPAGQWEAQATLPADVYATFHRFAKS